MGFMVADALASEFSASWSKGYKGEYAEIFIGGKKHFILKPQTFMNLSGESVQPFCAFYKIPATDIVVVHDDLDMDYGKVKIKKGGSSGGHNGIKSIIQQMGTEDFVHVKMGIGKNYHSETIGHVLGKFHGEEADKLDEFIRLGVKTVTAIAGEGMLKAMSEYNNRTV